MWERARAYDTAGYTYTDYNIYIQKRQIMHSHVQYLQQSFAIVKIGLHQSTFSTSDTPRVHSIA